MSPAIMILAVLLVFSVAMMFSLRTISGRADSATAPDAVVTDAIDQQNIKMMLESPLRSLAAALFHGAILGLLLGGVGGRAAMRLLFLTSPAEVGGLESDDGFIIGRFDLGDTLGLLIFGLLIGIVGGAAYLLIRRWLPMRRALRSAVCAAGGGTVVGSMIVHADGMDFTVLEPLWLAVTLFVLIPTLFGALIPLLVDGSDLPESWFQRKPLSVAAAPLVVLLFPPLLILIGIPLAVTLLCRRFTTRDPRALALWESVQLVWAGRIAIAAVGALGAFALANDLRLLV